MKLLRRVWTNATLFFCYGVVTILPNPTSSQAAGPAGEMLVYVGTKTGPKSEGIYCFRLEMASGKLSPLGVTGGVKNPMFLAIHPTGDYLYAVSEISEGDKPLGAVTAFALNRDGGELTPLNHQSSEGAGPCYLSVDRAGKYVLVANYSGGSIASLPIRQDGSLAPATSAIRHTGVVAEASRKKGPLAHSINVSPDNRFAFAVDLGLDRIFIYKFDSDSGALTPHEPAFAAVAPGSGPRHFTFHPNAKYAYINNETKSSVTTFSYDADSGALMELQTITTLPADFMEKNSTAEILVHPSGKFLYCSNRGHDSLAIFAIDETTGKLSAVGHQSTLGKTPRNFGIDPTGAYILACNQASDSIVVMRIDQATGKLEPVGEPVHVGSPMCVKFLAIEQ